MKRAPLVAAALALGALAPSAARADVGVSVVPMLGPDTPPGDGWGSLVVRVESREAAPFRGTIEVIGDADQGRLATVAPISLAPGARTVVRLPTHGVGGWKVDVATKDASGRVVATQEVRLGGSREPLLFEIGTPPRLRGAIGGAKVPVHFDAHGGRSGSRELSVGRAYYDPDTGDPLLPEHAAEYSGATVVVIGSDALAKLAGPELEALTGYVIAGGTLAVAIRRPELRSPTLTAMVGGTLRDAGRAVHLESLRAAAPERDDPSSTGSTPPPAYEEDEEPAMGTKPKPKPSSPRALVAPSRDLRSALVAYDGGNVVASDFGSSAPYGLGEVHLLPFDPTAPPAVDDPWAHGRLVELVRHAWDRRATLVFLHGDTNASHRHATGDVRRQLDPNQSSRWAIVIAAMLLLAYSVVAGPVNFTIASRGGKPLRALVNLPILSSAFFFVVVALGIAAKGFRGEARRVSLIEASGGMQKASVRRYRGFFTPNAETMRVHASDETAVLDVVSERGGVPTLVVNRVSPRLEGVATLPWQTVVVREDAIVSLGGGVAVGRLPGGDVRVTNRLARDLRAVLVWAPPRGLYLFPTLKDGESVTASAGKLLTATPPAGKTPIGPTFLHPLGLGSLPDEFDRSASGVSSAWQALSNAAGGRSIDYWPDDLPVVMAQIEGGEGVPADTGLRVERDRTLLRVIGYGGVP